MPSSIVWIVKSMSGTGDLFCIASIAFRVCSYILGEPEWGGGEEAPVDEPIDMLLLPVEEYTRFKKWEKEGRERKGKERREGGK